MPTPRVIRPKLELQMEWPSQDESLYSPDVYNFQKFQAQLENQKHTLDYIKLVVDRLVERSPVTVREDIEQHRILLCGLSYAKVFSYVPPRYTEVVSQADSVSWHYAAFSSLLTPDSQILHHSYAGQPIFENFNAPSSLHSEFLEELRTGTYHVGEKMVWCATAHNGVQIHWFVEIIKAGPLAIEPMRYRSVAAWMNSYTHTAPEKLHFECSIFANHWFECPISMGIPPECMGSWERQKVTEYQALQSLRKLGRQVMAWEFENKRRSIKDCGDQ